MKKKDISIIYSIFKCYKKNLFFLFSSFIFIILVFFKIISWNKLEWFKGADYLFDVLINLSLGIFVSIIFYILVVFYPNEKKSKAINDEINYSISKIYNLLLLETNIDKFSELDIENLRKLEQNKDVEKIKEFYKEQSDKLVYLKENIIKSIIKNISNFIFKYEILINGLKAEYQKGFEFIDFEVFTKVENIIKFYENINAENIHYDKLKKENISVKYSVSVQNKNIANFVNLLDEMYNQYIDKQLKKEIKNMVLMELFMK